MSASSETGQSEPLHPLLKIALGLLIFALLVYLFMQFALLFQQLLLAVFLFYLTLPVKRFLVERGLPSWLAYLLIVVATTAIITAASIWIYNSLLSLIGGLGQFEERADEMIQQIADWIPGVQGDLLRTWLYEYGSPEQWMDWGQQAAGYILALVAGATIVFIFYVLLLVDQRSQQRRLRNSVGEERAERVLEGIDEIVSSVSRYLLVNTFCNLLIGTYTGLVMWFFGVEGAVFWGFLGFLLPYILYIGPIIAGTLPGVYAIITLDSPLNGLIVLGLLHLGQGIFLTFLQPLLVGKSLRLSPLVVLISLVFWGTIWGVIGMIISAPLLIVVKLIFKSIPATKPLSALLGEER